MKLPVHFFCPSCNQRQEIGTAGGTLDLPRTMKCGACGAALTLEKSESGGIHVRADAPISH